MHPPTVFVIHPKERRSKCSVDFLRGREGFVFWKFPQRGRESLDNYVRLGLGGEVLGGADADSGLLILDGTWRLASRMEPDYRDLPVRSLLPWKTAYPRVSKLFSDPAGGLSTIEALYAATIQLGRDPQGLLDEYRWRDEFLELNRDLLAEFR